MCGKDWRDHDQNRTLRLRSLYGHQEEALCRHIQDGQVPSHRHLGKVLNLKAAKCSEDLALHSAYPLGLNVRTQ